MKNTKLAALLIAATAATTAACDGTSAPSASNGSTAIVVGSSIKPKKCNEDKDLPSCDFTYKLKLKSNGKTRTISVRAKAYHNCHYGDRWPSCGD